MAEENPNATLGPKKDCVHTWWYKRAGTMEIGDQKIDMFEARCNSCGGGRAMDARTMIKEMGLQPYIGQILLNVIDTATKTIMPLFDSPTKQPEAPAPAPVPASAPGREHYKDEK